MSCPREDIILSTLGWLQCKVSKSSWISHEETASLHWQMIRHKLTWMCKDQILMSCPREDIILFTVGWLQCKVSKSSWISHEETASLHWQMIRHKLTWMCKDQILMSCPREDIILFTVGWLQCKVSKSSWISHEETASLHWQMIRHKLTWMCKTEKTKSSWVVLVTLGWLAMLIVQILVNSSWGNCFFACPRGRGRGKCDKKTTRMRTAWGSKIAVLGPRGRGHEDEDPKPVDRSTKSRLRISKVRDQGI